MTAQQETQLLEDVAMMRTAILGNGTKGLAQRMTEIETWRHSHPRVCPMEAAPNPRKANIVNVLLGVAAAVGVCGSVIVAILK